MQRCIPIIALAGLISIACRSEQPQEKPRAEQPQSQSSRGIAETTLDGKKISISYGKPSVQGRDLLAMAPVGTVWRAGMDEATEIISEADLMVSGQHLSAGKYSLWVRKTAENKWKLAFHPQTGVWGAPELKEGYVGEIPLTLEQVSDSAEQLVIRLNGSAKDVNITIHWGTSRLKGTFQTM